MNEIVYPTTDPPSPRLATLSLQVPPIRVNMSKLIHHLFSKMSALEQRVQSLEQELKQSQQSQQSQQNRTHQ